MDTFFISHGSPTLAINDKLPARDFLKSWQEKVFPERPKAVLVISGHWDTSEPAVSVINGPNDVIYDFYGFPEPMYEVGIFSFLHLLDRVLFFLERIHEWREITYASETACLSSICLLELLERRVFCHRGLSSLSKFSKAILD